VLLLVPNTGSSLLAVIFGVGVGAGVGVGMGMGPVLSTLPSSCFSKSRTFSSNSATLVAELSATTLSELFTLAAVSAPVPAELAAPGPPTGLASSVASLLISWRTVKSQHVG
jgi:hypothetical protein